MCVCVSINLPCSCMSSRLACCRHCICCCIAAVAIALPSSSSPSSLLFSVITRSACGHQLCFCWIAALQCRLFVHMFIQYILPLRSYSRARTYTQVMWIEASIHSAILPFGPPPKLRLTNCKYLYAHLIAFMETVHICSCSL